MILFVDDDPYYIRSYLDELRDSGFEVIYQSKVAAAMRRLEDRSVPISLVITDIMMASGGVFKFDLRTGFAFYDWVRERTPRLPIIVLTNVGSRDVDEKFADDQHCVVLRKSQCLPYELVDHVKRALK